MNISPQPTTPQEGGVLDNLLQVDKENSKVTIVLDTKDFHRCCAELIRHQVAFEVKYNVVPTSTLPSKREKQPEYIAPDNVSDIVKEIYGKYLEGNFKTVSITENEIAESYGIRLALFKSVFKRMYGKSFYQLYLDKRMEHAASLLRKGYKANEAAAMIGYSASSAIKFNKMFQKHFHMTPKKYQLQFFGKINRR